MNIPRPIRQAAPYAALILGVFLFFRFLLPFVAPFVIGFLLSLILSPLADILEKRLRFPRWLGSLLAIALMLGLLGLLGVSLGKRLADEAMAFWAQLPGYLASLEESLQRLEDAVQGLLSFLPEKLLGSFDFSLSQLFASLIDRVAGSSAPFLPLDVVLALPNAFLNLIFTLLATFFFTEDRWVIRSALRRLLPQSLAQGYRAAAASLTAALWGYVRAQLIIMLYIFGICLAGFLILGSPYAFLLALVTAVVDALPFFGSGAILWPAALLALILGDAPMAVGYLVIYLLVSLVRQILQPKVLSAQIGLHPLWALFAMFLGWRLLGVIGFIVGPVLGVLLKAVYQVRHQKNDA